MKPRSPTEHAFFMATVGLLAWAIPGAGHFLIGERRRAIIIFVTIALTFVTGLYVGSIGVIDPVNARPWYIAQIMASPLVGVLSNVTRSGQYEVTGRPSDVGQIYTSIAGMLNLLCILSAVYMAYQGRGEVIGTEEDDHA